MQQQFRLSDSVASYNCSIFSLACFPREGACKDFPAEWEWQGTAGQMTCEAAPCSTGWSLQRAHLKGKVSRGFSVCVGFYGCCFLLCFLQLSALC